MRQRARIGNHPIHPMIVVFPIALWIFSFVCDLVATRSADGAFWSNMAFYTMAGGVIGALAAAVPGFVDYLSLSDRRVKRVATTHMTLNLIVVVLYVFNLGFRINQPVNGSRGGILISAFSIVLLAISGWLGGALVYEYGVAVQPQVESPADRGQRAA